MQQQAKLSQGPLSQQSIQMSSPQKTEKMQEK